MADFANNYICQYKLRAFFGLAFEWNPIKGSLPLHFKLLVSDLIEVGLGSVELQ